MWAWVVFGLVVIGGGWACGRGESLADSSRRLDDSDLVERTDEPHFPDVLEVLGAPDRVYSDDVPTFPDASDILGDFTDEAGSLPDTPELHDDAGSWDPPTSSDDLCEITVDFEAFDGTDVFFGLDSSGSTDSGEWDDVREVWDWPDTFHADDLQDIFDKTDAIKPLVLYTCLADSFEGDSGWEATGLWHRIHANQDIVNIWAAPPFDYVLLSGPVTLTKPKDGKYAYWYGQDEDGSYIDVPDDNQVAGGGTSVEPHEGVLVSPWIDLTGASFATLYFWSWWEIESKHPVAYDLSTVEVTSDGDAWVEVARLNPPFIPHGAHPVLPYTVNGVGMPPSWHRTVVSLDAFAGRMLRLRFRFRTEDVFYNAFRGWVVDQVLVECVGRPNGGS